MIYLIRISQLLNKLSIIIGHIIIEMHFLSSKIVGQLQITLKLILDPEHVKEGERRIVQLREQSCYQLALATFISRSLSYNQKLLAIIELEKLQYLRQQQTIWLLKQVYFKENDKIASKIRKIMSKEKNIQMIGEFLKVDINICGSTVYRQIQFLFSLLKSRETAQKVIRQYFAELCQYFKKSISLLQAGQQSFFHFTVNLAQFYAYVTKTDENMIWQKVIQLWQYISKNYENGIQIDTQMLVISIKNNLNIINIGYQRGTFSCVLSNYFKQVSRNNLERIKFLLKTVELFCNSGPILDNVYIREEFIEAILQYSKNSSKNSILSVKLYGQAELIQNNHEFDEGNDSQVNKICGKIVESIFISYNQWLFNDYLQNLGNYSKKYWIIVSLFMFVEQQFIKYIKRQIPDFFHELESQLENNLKFLKAEGSNKQKLEYCISILSMLSKFKEQISIKRLPSLIITLLDASEDCTILMPFCDSFTQHIWKQLTFLQAQDLYAFLDLYLRSLNQNQWTVKIKSYESIINIALYLEQTFQFYSHSIPNEPLFNKSIYAHRRISLMLEQNSSTKVDHQFLQLFFEFTKILLSNQNISNVLDLSQHLKIPYLIHKIETLHLFSQTTAIIIAVYNFYSHSFHSFKDWLQKFHLLLKQDSEFCLNVYLKIMELASSSRSSDYVPNYANMIINTIEKSIPRLGEGCKIHRENSKCWKQFISRYSVHNSQNQIMQIQRI